MVEDLSGKRFGMWTVISYGGKHPKHGFDLWACRCDCGKEKSVFRQSLISGKSSNCGCVRARKLAQSHEGLVKPGERYGRWTVLQEAERYRRSGDGKEQRRWLCRCECGTEIAVHQYSLRSGKSISCGCMRDQLLSERFTKHGFSGGPEYHVWQMMIQRCRNPKQGSYRNYGGRGITVCDRWLNSFEAFLEDVGPRPSWQHSLDRINNDGNYEPGNVKWATRSEQANNRRQLPRPRELMVRLAEAERQLHRYQDKYGALET